jgi:hypothetical protein
MEFNKTNIKILTDKLSKLIEPLEKEFDIKIKRKSGKYTDNSLTLGFEILKIDDSGSVVKNADDFKLYAQMYGLEESDLERIFEYRGKNYKITGINPRSTKYPIQATDIFSKKKYKFPISIIGQALNKPFKNKTTYEEFIINSSDIGNINDIL